MMALYRTTVARPSPLLVQLWVVVDAVVAPVAAAVAAAEVTVTDVATALPPERAE